MKKIITLFALQFLTSTLIMACSCFGEVNFCATITSDIGSPPDVIVTAVKVEDVYYGMKVKVLETLDGETDRDTLMVWGDNGALCRLYTNGFSIGDTLILGLYNTDFSGNFITNPSFPADLEQEGDYHLSVCGIYYLTVQNGMVSGPIDPDTNQLPYESFLELACLVSGIPPIPEIVTELVPNPADQEITLYFWNSQPYPLSFQIFDALGRLVLSLPSVDVNLQQTVNVSSLENGIYYFVIQNDRALFTEKFLVVR